MSFFTQVLNMTAFDEFGPGKEVPLDLERNLFLANTPKYEVLEWKAVTPEDKATAVQNAAFDIDFVAVVGTLENVLNDDSFIELIGNSSGKICQLASIQNVRTKTFGRMLLYAKLGDWLLGEPLTREVLEEMEEFDFDEQTPDSKPFSTSTQVTNPNF
jgi:hypothetical protein